MAAMLESLAHRAPDGAHLWSEGAVALGHGALITTPDAALQRQPYDNGRVVVTADVRLDNRETLAQALGAPLDDSADVRLVAEAYEAWGVDCAERLLGDFAFAIWDRSQRRLFCARDHAGVKPLFYRLDDRALVLASEIKALAAGDLDPLTPSEAAIAEFLAGLAPESDATLYEGVRRLPSASAMILDDAGLRVFKYWTPAAVETRPADWPEAFGEVFERAVRRRMRSSRPVGAMLSGGLDSSSIVAVAAPLSRQLFDAPLPTYSVVFDATPQFSERRYIEAVLQGCACAPTILDRSGYAPLADIDQTIAAQDGLFFAPGFDNELYRRTAADGVRVILDGHGGDETVSHGFGRMIELADAGRWLELWQASVGVGRIYGASPWDSFLPLFGREGGRRKLARLIYRGRRKFAHLTGRAQQFAKARDWSEMIHPDLLARTNLAERRREIMAANAPASTEREQHLATVSSPMQAAGFEVLDRMSAPSGIEARFPFWDKELVQFCLGVPSEQKFDGGWPRLILRRAMAGKLPDSVRWRASKLDFTSQVVGGILRSHGELLEEVLSDRDGLAGQYVDLAAVRRALARLAADGEEASGWDLHTVWRTVVLSRWLAACKATSTPDALHDGSGRVIDRV